MMLIRFGNAAKLLGVSIKTLRRHVAAGNISVVQLGCGTKRSHLAFTQDDLNHFIERQRRRTSSHDMPEHSEFLERLAKLRERGVRRRA